jgi:hypothetical protein
MITVKFLGLKQRFLRKPNFLQSMAFGEIVEIGSDGKPVDGNYRKGTPVRLRGIVDTIREGKNDEAAHMLLETLAENPEEESGVIELLSILGQKGYIGEKFIDHAIKAGYSDKQLDILRECMGLGPKPEKILRIEQRLDDEAIKIRRNMGIGAAIIFAIGGAIGTCYTYSGNNEKVPPATENPASEVKYID